MSDPRLGVVQAIVLASLLVLGVPGAVTGTECPDHPYLWELSTGEGPTPPGPQFQGDTAEYASAWVAYELCNRIFVAGADPLPTFLNEGHVLASFLSRSFTHPDGYVPELADVRIDASQERVTVHHRGQPPRSAVKAGSQACVILPSYSGRLHFEPRHIPWEGPPASDPWPKGESLWHGTSRIDRPMLEAAMDVHMTIPAPGTHQAGARALVVVHRGELVGERYKEGYGPFTPQYSWSVAKSLTSAVAGRIVDRGLLDLDAPVPVADWQSDDRKCIALRNMLNMSSGLEVGTSTMFVDPQIDPENGHRFFHWDGFNVVKDAIEYPLHATPGTVFEYRNQNPILVAALAREAADHTDLGFDPDALYERDVFEPLGMRSSTMRRDPYGNSTGGSGWFTTARDLARLGLVHLNGGLYAGEQFLSEEWVDFVSSPSPASSGYGGFWWLAPAGGDADAFSAEGALGTWIQVIPKYDLVIARTGLDIPDDVGRGQLVEGVIRAIEAGEGGS